MSLLFGVLILAAIQAIGYGLIRWHTPRDAADARYHLGLCTLWWAALPYGVTRDAWRRRRRRRAARRNAASPSTTTEKIP